MGYVIAIDGPAGSGKTTVSKIIANNNNLLFVSSGSLYRLCAFFFKKNNFEKVDEDFITFLENLNIQYQDASFYVDCENISHLLHNNDISELASSLASNIQIRNFVNKKINHLFNNDNIIMDGRDIGTVVFPNANLKIFLSASSVKRARRRQKELREKKISNDSFFKLWLSTLKRDWKDKHRAISPLKKAKDAIKISSTKYTIDQVVAKIQELINKDRMKNE